MTEPHVSQATDLLKRHEGYMPNIYRCPAGKLTIGYGYNLDAGMPEDEAMVLIQYRTVKNNISLTLRLPWYAGLSQTRRAVLLDMAYQLGITGLLNFRRMLAACGAGVFTLAVEEMLDSKWAREDSPERAAELAKLMLEG